MKLCYFGIHKWVDFGKPIYLGFVYSRGHFSHDFYPEYLVNYNCKNCNRFKSRIVSEKEIMEKERFMKINTLIDKAKYNFKAHNYELANRLLKIAEII